MSRFKKYNQQDLFAGEELRDAGMKKAVETAEIKSPGWMEHAIDMFRNYPEEKFTPEDVGKFARENGLKWHPPSWGPATKEARKLGIIRRVGKWTKCKKPSSHGHETPIYEKI